MAGYLCALCDGAEPGTILVTPLTGGDTLALGPDCAPIGLVGIVAGIMGVDAERLAAQVDKWVKAERQRAAGAVSRETTPPAGRRRRPPAAPNGKPAAAGQEAQ